MLRVLREHATSWMLRGILLLVAVTFISWGGYSLIRERDVTYAAKVNDTLIGMRDYQEAYEAMVKRYRDMFGPNFSEKMLAELRLKEKVLDDLISRVLMLQEGRRLGLSVSDDELRESIESIPGFRPDGQFDPRIYERFLRLNRMSAADFERLQRDNLVISKIVQLIRQNGGRVSDEEVLETFNFENEKMNLLFLKVSPEAFRGQVEVNEIELKDYFQKHQDEFRTPTLVQVQYLLFRPSDFEARVQPSADDVKRSYDQQKERFKTPRRVKAREILIKVAPQEAQGKMEEKRKKAEEILEKAKKTKDFASLAKQTSESPTAGKGGDLGWVQRGALEEPLEKALLSLKAGELSPVVRGTQGFYVFKADEVTEEKQKTLEEVKDQILQLLRREKGKKDASRYAEDAFYSLFRSRDLEGYAKEKNIPIRTTGLFKEGDDLPDIGRDPSFVSAALSLKVGEISPVVASGPNFYILKLVDKKESRIPSFDEIKEEVRRKVVAQKADEKARQVAEDLLKQVQGNRDIIEVAREKGLAVDETGPFARAGGMIPKVGPAGDFMKELSSLTEQHRTPREVLKTKDGYFVVKLAGLEPADQAKFAATKNELERRLQYQKQEEFFQSFINQLRKRAKVDINKNLASS